VDRNLFVQMWMAIWCSAGSMPDCLMARLAAKAAYERMVYFHNLLTFYRMETMPLSTVLLKGLEDEASDSFRSGVRKHPFWKCQLLAA
jgi:hypothetical protein